MILYIAGVLTFGYVLLPHVKTIVKGNSTASPVDIASIAMFVMGYVISIVYLLVIAEKAYVVTAITVIFTSIFIVLAILLPKLSIISNKANPS